MAPPSSPPSRAAGAAAARRLVEAYALDALGAWAAAEPRAARVLQALLFDEDERVCCRAAEALGRVAAVRARETPEPAREMVRRAFWLMNDESGGILWYGPQLVGAVLANVPALCAEYGDVLASFLEDEPFRAGTRWALWRIAGTAPDVLARATGALTASLRDPDPRVRGHAALALHAAGREVAELAGDGARFTAFDHRTGELRELTVAEAAGLPGAA